MSRDPLRRADERQWVNLYDRYRNEKARAERAEAALAGLAAMIERRSTDDVLRGYAARALGDGNDGGSEGWGYA